MFADEVEVDVIRETSRESVRPDNNQIDVNAVGALLHGSC